MMHACHTPGSLTHSVKAVCHFLFIKTKNSMKSKSDIRYYALFRNVDFFKGHLSQICTASCSISRVKITAGDARHWSR